MNRNEAMTLLQEHVHNHNLIKHSLAVEACLGSLARHFSTDGDTWRLAGLLHDLDYEYTLDKPEEHTLKTATLLEEKGISDEIVHSIKAHNRRVVPQSNLDFSLLAVDPATGFIIACALMHPEKKLAPLDLPFMKKRFKEKSFAKGASREQMQECRHLNLELDSFLQICLTAMQEISGDLGL